MFNGVDKYSGKVIEGDEANCDDISTVLSTSSATETIIASNEEGTLIAFKAKLDTEEGGLMWNPSYDVQNDYKTALSTSQMVSMLHDTRRNELYKKAINQIIQDFIKENNRPPTVLDIGSGTGLLSLLAAEAGAAKVLAFEQMKILADISTQIIEDNGYNSKITVLNLKSTQLSEENEDLKCDVMVSEILDSILLGEGVIPAVRHAKKYLLNKNNIKKEYKIIPQNAKIYGSLIYSKTIENMSSIENMYIHYNDNEIEHLSGSEEEDKCMNGVNCLPVHTDNLDYIQISDYNVIHNIDLINVPEDNKILNDIVKYKINQNGKINGILIYWECNLYNNIIYSTKPNEEICDSLWQDHWIPIIYPLQPTNVSLNDEIALNCYYNNRRLWFSFYNHDDDINSSSSSSILKCNCLHHIIHTPMRISMLNNQYRNKYFENIINEGFTRKGKESLLLDISDGSLCTFISSKLYPNSYSIEDKTLSIELYSKIAKRNHNITILNGTCKLLTPEIINNQIIDILISEIFYYQMEDLVIMSAFNYWYQKDCLLRNNIINKETILYPAKCNIVCAVVEFKDLYNGYGLAGSPCGFNHKSFDNLLNNCWNNYEFPFPLWMYKTKLLSNPSVLIELNYTEIIHSLSNSININIKHNGIVHGLVIWTEFLYSNNYPLLSTGLNDKKEFSKEFKQIVKFVKVPKNVEIGDNVNVKFEFDSTAAEWKIEF